MFGYDCTEMVRSLGRRLDCAKSVGYSQCERRGFAHKTYIGYSVGLQEKGIKTQEHLEQVRNRGKVFLLVPTIFQFKVFLSPK